MFLACFVVKNLVNATAIAQLILQVAIGIIVYFTMLIILKDDYIFKFIGKIKNREGKI